MVDDVHELGPEALRQLELLIMRAPPELRFVLATRHDVRLGLHRLRLEGGLAEAPQAVQPGLGEELRALALISLGSAEFWAARFEEAERHLEQGVALARRIGRPFLEFTGLVYAASEFFRSAALAAEHSRQAVELAEQHGWTDAPAAGLASLNVARLLMRQGRLEEAEPWIQRADRTLRAEAEPAVGLVIRSQSGLLELARGQDADALATFQVADQLAGRLAEPSLMVLPNRSFLVQTLVRLGETERAEQTLAALGDQDRDRGAMRTRPGGAAARAAQPARGDRRARAGSRRLRAGTLAGLADSGALAGGDRPRRGRRPGRRRARPGARARPGRTRRRTVLVPAAPGTGPAGAARPARHQLCSWAGLTPRHYESDTRVIRGHVSKQGSRMLRWALVEAIQRQPAGTRPRQVRDAIIARRGAEARGIAKTAAARQLLTQVFYGMRDGHIRRVTSQAA